MARSKKEYPPFDYSQHLTTYVLEHKDKHWTMREWNQRFYDWAQDPEAPIPVRALTWIFVNQNPYSRDLVELLRFMSAAARQGGLTEDTDFDAMEMTG